MATWTDSRVVSATVASVSETQVGSINIPQNQSWLITSLFFAHPQGGTGRLAVDSLPGLNGVMIQNTTSGLTLGTNAGSSSVYPQNFVITGPAVVELYVSNAAATSGLAKAMIGYQITTTGAQ